MHKYFSYVRKTTKLEFLTGPEIAIYICSKILVEPCPLTKGNTAQLKTSSK